MQLPQMSEASSYNALGIQLAKAGKLPQAIRSFQQATKLSPAYTQAHYNLGSALRQFNYPTQAIPHFQTAIRLSPHYLQAYNNLGICFEETGQPQQAIKTYRQALKLNPNYVSILNNLGSIYLNQNKYALAKKLLRRALKYQPNHLSSLINLASTYTATNQINLAAKNYKKALQLDPDQTNIQFEYCKHLMQLCDWFHLKKAFQALDTHTLKSLNQNHKPSETPFISIARSQNNALNSKIAQAWSHHLSLKMASLDSKLNHPKPHSKKKTPKRKLKIGYLSADFKNHAVSHLLLNLFSLHNRQAFNIHAYYTGKQSDDYYHNKLKTDADTFTYLSHLSDLQAATQIYQDKIDILIDLMGYTKGSRLEILALKPSPVQAAWLGYPGTTGADFIDYIITDHVVTPPDTQPYYSEKFAYLPHCYQINDNQQPISTAKVSRSQFDLPPNAFVFFSFSLSYKIEAHAFKTWIRLLRQIPHSVLWVLPTHKQTGKNLKQVFANFNIDPKRLILADIVPKPLHLKRIQLADLGLDTFTYNGHTTTSDAIWAGVPVITYQGRHFASRVASSILSTMDLPELITTSKQEYLDLALNLATHPKKLISVRQKINRNIKTSPLFDTPRFVKYLEDAYHTMWHNYQQNQPPGMIQINE